MNVYALGASRNIGYFSSIRLLEQGATVTLLVRFPNTFQNDAVMQKYIASNKARIIVGDALNLDDVTKGWQSAVGASPSGLVDLVLFTVGTSASASFSLTKGAILPIPDLCTRALLNTLSTLPASLRTPESQPRIIVLSSTGLSKASTARLPLIVKPFYSWALDLPHADKYGVERVLTHCEGKEWTEKTPLAEILPAGWEKQPGLPAPGEFKKVLIIRAAWLTDGVSKADLLAAAVKAGAKCSKPAYRLEDDEVNKGTSGYTISRRDVAHFIVENALPNWDQWQGKRVSVAY